MRAVAGNRHLVAGFLQQELERHEYVGLVLGDQDLFRRLPPHACRDPGHVPNLGSGRTTGARAGRGDSSGTVNEKVEPSPGRLRTHKRPPKWSMIWREMASPRPLPLGFWVSVSPTWRNFSNISSWSAGLIPT